MGHRETWLGLVKLESQKLCAMATQLENQRFHTCTVHCAYYYDEGYPGFLLFYPSSRVAVPGTATLVDTALCPEG